MPQVKIDITVDTVKLLATMPNGGEITDRTIVVMTDDQPDSIYKDSNGGIYKDKLTTATDPDDNIFWEIDAVNKKDKLVLVKCNPSAALTAMLSEQPHEDSTDANKKWKAKLKGGLGKSVAGFYTFEFNYKNSNKPNWSWDPGVQTRPVG